MGNIGLTGSLVPQPVCIRRFAIRQYPRSPRAPRMARVEFQGIECLQKLPSREKSLQRLKKSLVELREFDGLQLREFDGLQMLPFRNRNKCSETWSFEKMINMEGGRLACKSCDET